ncbi:MAG: class I SAM-dependent RNA methyltransferase [Clostridiales Family XIII bacterium]|jgi:putative N6-adenine-specific DNA methylase|nr:class I SAM-dependent RNA methyltransferase [Clostridiales Family XIII bacterium]
MKYNLVATATFGLEAIVKREVEKLGYKVLSTEDSRVTFLGNEEAIVRANLWLRSADRVFIKLAEFDASEFEDIYQGVLAIPFEEYIPLDGNFTTDAVSVKSKLSAVPSIQSVAEKAIVHRMQSVYSLSKNERLSKTGASYKIRISLHKDRVLVLMDTSGAGLHKRGYRTRNVAAPIKETLAAAMVSLSFWKSGRLLLDPFCGSGTIAIEAAMSEMNIAPGLGRKFASEDWHIIDSLVWKEERSAAFAAIRHDRDIRIVGFDIDAEAIEAARENAINAGVDDVIEWRKISFEDFVGGYAGTEYASEDFGIIITNPPYGERIGEKKQVDSIYREVGSFLGTRPTWSLYLITTDENFEATAMGRPADRRRKLYNGRLKTTYYQYYGARPPKI